MNKAEILELAARVEALEGANGADRELNCLIFKATGAPVPLQFASKFIALTFMEKEQAYFVELGDGMQIRYEPPNYTSSIDAAMGLAPPDSWHEIKGPRKYLNIPTPVPNYWSAHLARWNHEGDAMGWGATPALALTAACLRAIASTMEDDRG